MGIDGIGSRGPLPPAAPPVGSAGPGKVSAPTTGSEFEVGSAKAAAPAEAAPTSPLARLRAGQLDARGYVDAKVEEATAHLRALPPAKLDAIRAALRERMSTDPTLVDLVKTATGQAVPERDD